MNPLVVQLKAVSVWQKEHRVLENVNLRMGKGEFVYMIGKTGSGKSSLLKTLYGDLPLQNGQGQVVGFDLANLPKKDTPLLRRKMGIIFQDFNLLTDRNVFENLDFVLRATGWKDKTKRKQRIETILEQVGLSHKINAMPYALSGGEQQRVVIARALLNNPELIIADEPTGNLDPETSDDILLLLRDLARKSNTAVLFATHDYRILELFPARILRCRDGKLLDEEEISL